MTKVQQAADIIPAFAAAFHERKVESLLKLYEPDAVVIDKDGAEHRGHEAIARELAGLVALGGKMTSTNRYTLVQGDLALLSAAWSVEGKGADGAALTVSGRSSEVARRQSDGSWLYVLDHPFGA